LIVPDGVVRRADPHVGRQNVTTLANLRGNGVHPAHERRLS
jgi:hypothetical protein